MRACELLPQLAKVRQDSTGTEVVRNHADTRSQAGLNVRPNNKPRLHGLLSQQTCQSQHRWGTTNDRKEANHGCVCAASTCSQHGWRVTVVGAADDGSDDHGPVCKLILLTAVQERNSNVLLILGDVEPFKSNLGVNDLLDYPSQRQTGRAVDASGLLTTFSSRQLWKSSFMLPTATLSWGLFGPLTWGTMELRLISITCSKVNH